MDVDGGAVVLVKHETFDAYRHVHGYRYPFRLRQPDSAKPLLRANFPANYKGNVPTVQRRGNTKVTN
jgi:hypothetical protein